MNDDLLALNDNDLNMIVDGLEELKSKGFLNEFMGTMFDSLLGKKEKDMTLDEKLAYQKEKEEKERIQKEKEAKHKEFKAEVDIVKSKIILLREARKNRRFAQNSVKLAEKRSHE